MFLPEFAPSEWKERSVLWNAVEENEKTKDRLHFIESFHGGVFSWKEKCLKPDARIYRILLKRYDLNPASCLFFDDREDNIVAACREGIHGVVFGPSVVEEILHNR